MSNEARSRFAAPIRYRDVRTAYNTTRAIGGLAIVVGSVIAWAGGSSPAPWVMLSGVLVGLDGVYRRERGVSALPLLIVDIVAVGAALLARGQTPSIEAAAVAYVVTASLLLLSRRDAAFVVAFALAWAVPIGLVAPLAGEVVGGTRAAIG